MCIKTSVMVIVNLPLSVPLNQQAPLSNANRILSLEKLSNLEHPI